MLALTSCSLTVSYIKTGSRSISFPENLHEAFSSTTIEQIEWYLAASNEWDYSRSFDRVHASHDILAADNTSQPYVTISVFTQGYFDNGAKYESTQLVDLRVIDVVELDLQKRKRQITTA
jgi:hypothetical protein